MSVSFFLKFRSSTLTWQILRLQIKPLWNSLSTLYIGYSHLLIIGTVSCLVWFLHSWITVESHVFLKRFIIMWFQTVRILEYLGLCLQMVGCWNSRKFAQGKLLKNSFVWIYAFKKSRCIIESVCLWYGILVLYFLVLYLPMHPCLSNMDIDDICNCLLLGYLLFYLPVMYLAFFPFDPI